MKKAGFTLMEMLVVIGIISVLMGVAVAGFGGMTKRAQRAKTQELVSNAATALTMIFQEKKSWPKPKLERPRRRPKRKHPPKNRLRRIVNH